MGSREIDSESITERFPTNHETLRENRKDYICEYCGRSFGKKSNLHTHIKIVHKKQKDHRCEICNKTFGTKRDLKRNSNGI